MEQSKTSKQELLNQKLGLAKRSYRTPHIREYGRLEQLTLGNGQTGTDTGSTMTNQMKPFP